MQRSLLVLTLALSLLAAGCQDYSVKGVNEDKIAELLEKEREASSARFDQLLAENQAVNAKLDTALAQLGALKVQFEALSKDVEAGFRAARYGQPAGITYETKFFQLADLSSRVAKAEGGTTTVRYDVLIAFAGGEEEADKAITHFEQSNRDERLRGIAHRVMREYTLDDIVDASFVQNFSERLLVEFNAVTRGKELDFEVIFVDIPALSWE